MSRRSDVEMLLRGLSRNFETLSEQCSLGGFPATLYVANMRMFLEMLFVKLGVDYEKKSYESQSESRSVSQDRAVCSLQECAPHADAGRDTLVVERLAACADLLDV